MKIYSIKGTKDYIPNKSNIWIYLFDKIKIILSSYNFDFINFPILENTIIFKKILNNDFFYKEMYSFKDKSCRSITLRPEGTSCCIRFGIENGLLRGQKQKWWYFGPMFRYEKPQLYRYREFYQLGIEAFGFNELNIELELILLINRFFKNINILNNLNLEINFIGSDNTKKKYINYINYFLFKNINIIKNLCNVYSIIKNPFKIFNIKNIELSRFIFSKIDIIYNFLTIEEYYLLKNTSKLLDFFGINYNLNPFLFRGITYYNNIIFEWKSKNLGYNLTICAGGRYNCLTKKLGGISTFGTGLAIGWDRLIELFIISNKSFNILYNKNIKILITSANIKYYKYLIIVSENIRNKFPNIIINTDLSISSLNKKISKFFKNYFFYIIIICYISYKKNIFLFKDILNNKNIYMFSIDEILKFINNIN